MLVDFYHHKEIYDKDGEYKYTVSAHYKDRINYYRCHSDYLSRNTEYIDKISDHDYNYDRTISLYKNSQNIRNFNPFNSFHLDKISSCKTIEKLSDYYFKG